jgi:hypothetical protein
MAPLFEQYGIQLWLPGAGGPVDLSGEGHEEAMLEATIAGIAPGTACHIWAITASGQHAAGQRAGPGSVLLRGGLVIGGYLLSVVLGLGGGMTPGTGRRLESS